MTSAKKDPMSRIARREVKTIMLRMLASALESTTQNSAPEARVGLFEDALPKCSALYDRARCGTSSAYWLKLQDSKIRASDTSSVFGTCLYTPSTIL